VVTATPSGTPTGAPVLPEEAKENTKVGAVAFVRHYVDLINYAQATGDVEALAAVEADSCKSCVLGREFFESVYAMGGRIEGGTFRAAAVAPLPNPVDGDWLVAVGFRIASDTVFRPGQTPEVTHHKASRLLTSHIVKFVDGGWRIIRKSQAS